MGTYGKEVAKAIIKCRDDEFGVEKNGVFPKDDRPSSETEFDALTWRPACELGGQAGQKVQKSRAYRFPLMRTIWLHFFCMAGAGMCGTLWVVGRGTRRCGVFWNEIDHLERGEVEDAVRGAYDAYRAAECVVGKFDNTLACKAQELENAYSSAEVSLGAAERMENVAGNRGHPEM